jgi:CheY-like chemotaxis protein
VASKTTKDAVLVVEDDLDALEAIVDLLECEGYAAFGARSGDETLRLLPTIPLPAVILCDVMMPGMNGAELTAALLHDARFASVPILYFSAARGAELIVGAHVLKKPFSLEALLAAIEHELEV